MFNGIFSAIVTPFKNNLLEVDYESLGNLVDYQLDNKISGLVVCGSTGEAATLSKDEYYSVLKFVKEKVSNTKLSYDLKLIAGVGSNNTNYAANIAKEIDSLKYDALLVVAPPYNKPSQDGIYEHIKAVKNASSSMIIAYNVPGRTVSNILPQTVKRLADDDIIVGLKEASGNFSQLNEVLSKCRNQIDILLGEDAFIFPSLSLGAKGGISVVSNVFPKLLMDLYNLSSDNIEGINKAKEIHFKLLPFINSLFMESNPVPVKYALYKKGIIKDFGVRLPLLSASEHTQNTINQYLA